MSYTDDFWKALEEEEKKKKKKNGSVAVTQSPASSGDDYSDEFYREWQSLREKTGEVDDSFRPTKGLFSDDEDIAPVREPTWFQSGAFSDGWQFGDLTKTILGTVQDVSENVTTAVFDATENLIDTTAYGVGIVGGLFDEGFKDDVGKFIGKEILQPTESGEWAASYLSPIGWANELVNGGDTEANSVLGDKADGLVQSGAHLVGSYALQAVGVPAWLTMGVNAFGSEIESAVQQDATFEEAGISGGISALAEIVFEKISSGVKFKGTTFDEGLQHLLKTNIKNKVGRTIAKYTVDAVAEGGEEVATELVSSLGKKLTYMDDKEFNEIFSSEDALDAFVGGAVISGFAGGGKIANSAKTGRDFVSGLTANEESVVNKLYEDEIAKNGKMTTKEKADLYDSIVRDMERGYISTDTIEEILGGDSYKSYKDTIAKEDAIVKEFEDLKGKQNATLEEQARFKELRREYYRLQSEKGKTQRTDLKNKLRDDVFNKVKNDRLVESYLEKSRVGEDFQADLTKYEGSKHEDAAKKTIENAIKAGANNTNRVHDLVDMAAELSSETGYVYDFNDNEQIKNDFIERKTKELSKLEAIENRTAAQDEKIAKLKDLITKVQNNEVTVNGNVDSNGIVLNLDSAKPLNRIIGHEITHTVEKAKHYNKLRDSLFAYAKSKGVDIDAELEMKALEYEGVEGTTAEAELVADLVGDYLFTDSDYVRNLSTENRNLAQRIYDEIKYFLTKATQGSKEERELLRVKHEFEKAFRESAEISEMSDSETKHSLRTNPPPKETGVAYKVFFVKDGKLYPPMVANPEGADTPMGVWLDADVGTSAPPSKTGRAQVKAGGKGTQGGGGSLAFRPGWHLGDLPRASQFDRVNPETGKKELFPENFVWAEVEYAKDVDYQEEAMSYGYTDNGKFRHAYAGLPRLPENGYYRYRTNPKPDTVPWIITGAMKVNRLLSDAEVNQILEKNGVDPVHRQGGDVGLDKFGFDEGGAVKYSISSTTDGRFVAVVDNDILSNIDTSSWDDTKKAEAKKAASGALKQFSGGIVVDGITRKVNKVSRREYTRSNYTESLYKKDPDAFADKMRAAEVADDIVVVATDWERDGELKHPRNDNFVDFDHGKTLIMSGNAKYTAEVVVGITDTGEAVLYDVVDMTPTTFDIKKEESPTTATTQNAIGDMQGDSSGDSIAQEGANVKTQFSLSSTVEETKDLVALHNLTADKLTKSLELGGLPMPSLAITKADIPHSNFGEITLIFGKETIDPKASKKNKVYSADAWTPIFPNVEYEADSKVVNRVSQKLRELGGKVDEEFQRDLSRIGYSIEDYLNRQGGEEGLVQYVMDNYGLKAAYLEDIGKHIEPVTKQEEVPRNFNLNLADKYAKVMDILGVSTAEEVMNFNLKEARDNHGAELEEVFPGITQSGLRMGKVLGSVASYLKGKDSAPEYKTVIDSAATRQAVDDALDLDDFEAWTRNLFSGVVKDSGIYNNKDLFTPSGNRRSFKQTHLPVTLENIVKAMASQNGGNSKNVSGFNGVKTLRAATAETFKSIDDMHNRKGRLQHLTQEQADEITDALQARLSSIIDAIDNENAQKGDRNPYIRYDQIGQVLTEIGEGGKYNVADIQSVFSEYGRPVSDDVALEVKQLLYDVTQMPVNIFEAKPERVVGFDEAKVFVIPRNADVKLKQELLNRGYNIAEYDPDVEGDRQKVVNQFEEYKFSLSDAGKEFAPIGKNDFYGRDFRKKSADDITAEEDIAPVVTDTNVGGKPVNTPVKNVEADTNIGRENVMDEHPVAETVDAEALAGDRDSFMSQKAMELYKEITSLKKGVRASQRLGYLLDHGYEWRSIKTALLNIRDNPNQVVNPNSAAESVAREMLGREYDDMVESLAEPSDVAGKIRSKMQHIQTEIANNERLREQSNADYDTEIAEVQAEYDAKKNKNTIVANDLLRRIERLKRMKNTNDANYANRIGDLEARLEKMRQPTYKTAVQRKAKHDEYTNLMKNLVGDTTTWVDKKLGISYKVNTLRRNLRDVVRDADGNRDIAKADAIYDELQGKYNHNEAELKRESRRIKQVFADLKLNHAEDTYAHMLGEFRHNPDTKLTEEAVKEFYEKHKGKIDTKKVDTAIEESRKTFDELIVRVNERLKEQGMKEIPYRKGYFPHFTNPKQGVLGKLFNWKTVDTEIPTSIAGLTETFNPERSWQGFSKQRKGDTTDYSLEQGLDTYIHGALDWVYHIEDIQKRRALENHIRYIHSEEGVKARVDAINKSEELDADEAQRQIDAVYAEAKNPLNNFVTNLRAGTNTLANKKSENDRQWETNTSRKIYSVMTNLNNRVTANMVVGSFSSALTNFIPITQSWVEVSPVYSLKGMKDTIKSTIRDDGIVNKSDFLTNRLLNEENLYQTTWDKISDKAAFMMEAIDSFTSQTVWRSKYLQNISEGMSETEAIKNADQFAENVIAGRSRGNQPTIFDAKNPFTKMFTAFQLEVNNQYGYMFKDAPQDSKNKARLIKGYATAFLGAYAYNALYSSLVGRDAAFDPIGILEDLFRDMGLLGDDEEEEPDAVINNLVGNILEEVPFVGGLIGGGRIPISSAIPYGGDYKTIISNITNGEVSTKEWLKPVYYLALPVGGGQIKKLNEGMGMFSDEHPVAGSYTDSGNLRFPVEDNFWNRAQAALFGQYASENARDYFDNGRSPLKEKQIQEYMDVDIPIRDYWEYREGLAEQKTIEDKFDYIAGLDLPVSKKNILINNVVDREESVDLEGYEDFSSYDEFDFATKNPGKYAVSQAVGGYDAYSSYMDALGDITADKDANGKSISGSKKKKVFNYIESLPIDAGMKMILYKSMYDSEEDRIAYNAKIVAYLDSRDDISYEDMVTILTELGMRVSGNNVYWD